MEPGKISPDVAKHNLSSAASYWINKVPSYWLKISLKSELTVHVFLDETAKNQDNEMVIRNFLYVVLVCLVMLGTAGQGIAGTLSCGSQVMSNEAGFVMSDCADMDMDREQKETGKSNNCCDVDCASMTQCSKTSITFAENLAANDRSLPVSSQFLMPPATTPYGLASLPEIRPPIFA